MTDQQKRNLAADAAWDRLQAEKRDDTLPNFRHLTRLEMAGMARNFNIGGLPVSVRKSSDDLLQSVADEAGVERIEV